MGTCLYEYWDGITPTGTSLSLLYNWPDFPHNPTGTLELTLFEGPTNRAEQFGARIRAWLCAPVTGDYKFWIATDDNGELWLSSDEDPANKQLISWVNAWASPRNWTDADVIPSGLIPLVAGQKYYIEALMKEGGGSDNIAVGWTTPFDNTIQVITGNYLELFMHLRAWEPNPADGAPEVPRPITLRWWPGDYAAQHQVYFGTSEASMILKDTLALGTEEYDPPGTLNPKQTYYWKINEVNVAGPDPGMWEGDVWSFTAAECFVVDDMENYNDRTGIITVWRDGYTCVDWGDPPGIPPVTGGCSGSNISVSTEFAAPIYSGSQAMVFFYDNDTNCYVPGWDPYWSYPAPAYSEAKANTLNLPISSKDWSDFKALSLWFYGDPNNDTEKMYVALDDGTESDGVVYYDGDMSDIKIEDWQEWNIVLQDFNDQGVNLADVSNIYIGFGDRDNPQEGGSGVVYFDDIRLYPTRCVLSLRSPDFARVDFVEDCVVDYKEVAVMAVQWLVEATDPGTGNLVGWWKLDDVTGSTTAQDSSAYGNHGTLIAMDPASDWVTGRIGGALHFDGIDDYVDCGDTASLQITGTAISLAAWVKWETAEEYSAIAMKTSSGDWADGYGLYADTGPVSVNFYVTDYGFVATKSFAADDQWHHVVGTYDGSNVRIWVDGVEGTPISYTGSISNAVNSFEIGRGADDAYNFSGALDDVRVYNNLALTEFDILGLFGMRPDTYEDMKIDFKDYSLIASKFLEEGMFP